MDKNELLSRAVSDVVPRNVADAKIKSGKPMRVYLGIDPTGAKLHLGHSVPLRKLKAFADAGHHVIFLIGSFTAMIGDPSGQDKMREPLTREKVEENFETYKKQAGKILDFDKIELRYNHEWLEKLKFDEIVKIASSFTVHQMLERDMFQRRMGFGHVCPDCGTIVPHETQRMTVETEKGIKVTKREGSSPFMLKCPQCKKIFAGTEKQFTNNQPIGLHEFLYPLMVGYDSVILDVDVELGGNDQLFNMMAGRTLQKAYGKRDKFVLTTKLLEGTDGRKMSKTYDNCIWLEDSAKEMYGKLMSIKDDLIIPYFECVTDIPVHEINDIEKSLKKGMNPRDAKMRLAREVATLYHGESAAKAAEQEFTNVFAKHELPQDIPEVKVQKGTLLVDLIAKEKLVASKSEARRLIEQGGVHLNDKKVTSIDASAEEGILKVGKRKFLKIRL